MASIYPKFLRPVTIGSDNRTWGYNDGADKTVTLDKGTYDTVLEVCAALESLMGSAYTWTVSSLGIVSVSSTGTLTENWSDTDDALAELLGFDETETASGNVLTGSHQHTHGYYPGLIGYGRHSHEGVGVVSDSLWQSRWPMVRQVAGDGSMRVVGPATAQQRRTLGFGMITREEYEDAERGLKAFMDGAIAVAWRWYPDREDGTVANPGTQDEDYYLVTLARDLQIRQSRGSADHFTWSIELNREPA